MNWIKCVESFIRVVEAKSFAKAARSMYTTSSALSKHISYLEEALNVSLLQRTTRQLKLTSAGELLYQRSKALSGEWDEIKSEIMQHSRDPQGLLRIGARVSDRYIVPIIAKFLSNYPHIGVDLTLTNRRVDVIEEKIDVFISYDTLFFNPAFLEAWPLRKSFKQVMGSPQYFRRHGEPKNPGDLKSHNCLIKTGIDNPHIWELNKKQYPVKGNFSSDNMDSLISAAVNGLGLVYAPIPLVKDLLQKKSLKIVLSDHRSPEAQIFAYYPKHRFIPLKTKVLLEFLTQSFAEV